jgi:hypothetical protein
MVHSMLLLDAASFVLIISPDTEHAEMTCFASQLRDLATRLAHVHFFQRTGEVDPGIFVLAAARIVASLCQEVRCTAHSCA